MLGGPVLDMLKIWIGKMLQESGSKVFLEKENTTVVYSVLDSAVIWFNSSAEI